MSATATSDRGDQLRLAACAACGGGEPGHRLRASACSSSSCSPPSSGRASRPTTRSPATPPGAAGAERGSTGSAPTRSAATSSPASSWRRGSISASPAPRSRWCSLRAACRASPPGFFGGWVDQLIGRIADTIMAFPLFVLAMGIVAALGNTCRTSCSPRRSSTSRSTFASRGPRPCAARGRLRRCRAASRQWRRRAAAAAGPAQHPADHGGADVADHGLRHPQRRRPVLHRPRRAAADAGVGDHGRRGRQPSSSPASGGSRCSPARR